MAFLPRKHFDWRLRTRILALGAKTQVMGILNVTPDSFSDGGHFAATDAAVEQAIVMLDQGAHLLDIGGESTRPDAEPLPAQEEQSRVLPVIEAVLKERPGAILSIDTYHAATAQAAVAAGAEIVNDVSGFTWDPEMPATCSGLRCGVILMHTRGRPREWKSLPAIPPLAIMPIVLTGLRDSLFSARNAGVPSESIALDPGLGFGKIGDENYTVLALLHQMHQFGAPLLAGASRKGFLGRTIAPLHYGRPATVESRLHATTSANVAAVLAGTHIVRVHDVCAALEAGAIADAILSATEVVETETGRLFSSAASRTFQ